MGAQHLCHSPQSIFRLCDSVLHNGRFWEVINESFVLEMERTSQHGEIGCSAQDTSCRLKVMRNSSRPAPCRKTLPNYLGIVAVGLAFLIVALVELLGDDWVDEFEWDTSRKTRAGKMQMVLGSRFGADHDFFFSNVSRND